MGAVAAAAYSAWKFLAARAPDTAGVTFEAQPFPLPPRPIPPQPNLAQPVPAATASSISPTDDGDCPASHPIKGKRASGIYHQPGGFAYDRTRADRCYLDSAAAESDGLRAAKR